MVFWKAEEQNFVTGGTGISACLVKHQKLKIKNGLRLALCIFLCFASGCGSAWRGRIVYLEDGKVVIQPEGSGKIESGRKIRIYRQKTITHPVNDRVLGTITDNIIESPAVWVRNQTVTARVPDPYFDMIEVDDQAISIRGSVKPSIGYARAVGTIKEVNTGKKSVEIAVNSGAIIEPKIEPKAAMTVIKYSNTVINPDTGDVLAVAVEPVADLQVDSVDAEGRLSASYRLMDEKLGWVEVDDVVISRTGDMLAERLWFQDPPDGFSESWLFSRSYLHAIRYYNSGLYREAILDLKDVIQMDPDYIDASYLLGLCHANLKRYEEAITQFKDVLKLRPGDAKAWTALAYVYLNQGKLQEAVESYEKLAMLLPDDPELWIDIGDIHRTLGDHQKADQAYRKALELDQDNEEAKYELQAGKGEKDAPKS